MALTSRHQEELKQRATKCMQTSKDPIEVLRAKCLARGATGIGGLARLFKIMDDDKNRKLDFDEFRKGVSEYGLGYSKEEIYEIFLLFDKDGTGFIDFEEFLEKLKVLKNFG